MTTATQDAPAIETEEAIGNTTEVEQTPETKEDDKKPAAPRVPTRAEAFEDVKGRIVALTPLVGEAALEHERLKEDTKEAKAIWEGRAAQLTRLCEELVQIENGTWQPRLPFPAAAEEKPKGKGRKAKPVDPGATAPLSQLALHGMTDKQIETMLGSQLASEGPCKTIADLEAAIRRDEWWHKKIKGFGETKRDALIDALTAYRSKFPVPSEDDDEEETEEEPEVATAIEDAPTSDANDNVFSGEGGNE